MPIYDFVNTKTKKEFKEEMKIAELDGYLEANPHIKQVFKPICIGDAMRMGITQPDSWYQKNVIGRIQNSVPGARKDTRRFKIPREF
jgi:hypothetical protein